MGLENLPRCVDSGTASSLYCPQMILPGAIDKLLQNNFPWAEWEEELPVTPQD